jgi:hypothetical protein
MTFSKTSAVLRLWALALALSAALVAAGERWPEPLVPRGGAIGALLLGPPLLMTLWLLRRWRLQSGDPDRGESSE